MTPREILESLAPHSTASDVQPLLEHRETEEVHVLAILRKREIAPSVIEAVARHDRWNKRQTVRAAIVSHIKTPRTLALRMLPYLFWQEQLKVATNIRLSMPLRVAAGSKLKERLSELELGERISMARRAPAALVPALALDASHHVIRSLLQNARMKEHDVLLVLRRDPIDPEMLRAVAESERWVHRPAVVQELVCHKNTPVHVALSLAGKLDRRKLALLLDKGVLPPVVARRASHLLDDES